MINVSEQTLPLNRILNPKRRQHYCKQGDQCRGLGFGPVDKWGLGFAPVIPVINVSEQTLSKVINMLEKPLNPTCRPPKVRGLLNLIVAVPPNLKPINLIALLLHGRRRPSGLGRDSS